MIALRRLPVLLLPALLFAACDDDDPTTPGRILAVDQANVTISANLGGAEPAPVQVAITSSDGQLGNLSVATEYTGRAEGWLQASLSSTTTPATLTLVPSLEGLAPGNHTAVVILKADGASNSPRGLGIVVSIVVPPGPTVFSYTPPAGAPAITSIAVRGSFNGWGETPMTLVDGTWTVALPLNVGSYEYKFYINNSWPDDMCNNATWGHPTENSWIDPDADRCNGGNAVRQAISQPSHIFKYTPPEGAPEVTSISVRGGFNNWGETPMIKLGNEWRLGVELGPGQTEYKFYINNAWPDNMCDNDTWGDPDANNWIDPDADGCNGGNAYVDK